MSRKQPRSLLSQTHIDGIEIEDIDEAPALKPAKLARNARPKKLNKTAIALTVFKAEIQWIKKLLARHAATSGKTRTPKEQIAFYAKAHVRRVQLNALEATAAELAGQLDG